MSDSFVVPDSLKKVFLSKSVLIEIFKSFDTEDARRVRANLEEAKQYLVDLYDEDFVKFLDNKGIEADKLIADIESMEGDNSENDSTLEQEEHHTESLIDPETGRKKRKKRED